VADCLERFRRDSASTGVAGWQYTNRFPSLHRVVDVTCRDPLIAERRLGQRKSGKQNSDVESSKSPVHDLHVYRLRCCRGIFKRSCWKQRILMREPRCRYRKYITDVLVREDISWISGDAGKRLLILATHGANDHNRHGRDQNGNHISSSRLVVAVQKIGAPNLSNAPRSMPSNTRAH